MDRSRSCGSGGRQAQHDYAGGKGTTAPGQAVAHLVKALEAGGVVFVAENGGGPGVRLKKRSNGPQSIATEDLNASNDE